MPVRSSKASQATTSAASEEPTALKPYSTHGIEYVINGAEAIADCPLCGREGKLSININSGQWRCFACGGGRESGGGGPIHFLEALWGVFEKETTSAQYATLCRDRGLRFPETVIAWGLAFNPLTGNWIVPGWTEGLGEQSKKCLKFAQLYEYRKLGHRKALFPTPGCHHVLMGLNLFSHNKSSVYVAEGLWDGMALWETLRQAKLQDDGKLATTANPDDSLQADVNVLAVPSCTVFNGRWAGWFKDKEVALLYDNDHPKSNPNDPSAPPLTPGYTGMERTAGKLAGVTEEVTYLSWGPEGYDLDLPNGYDVHDALTKDPQGPVRALATLLDKIQAVPSEWLSEAAAASNIQCRACNDWQVLVRAWRKALKWTDGLEHGLACMLATIASTGMIGDQLWLKIIGPASSGKSTLAEAVSVNKQFVLAKSTLRGFHSGFKPQNGESGGSLLDAANGKTFITKDGDTLLQAPNLGQILAEGRDIYDGVSRTHYRNNMGKDYDWLRMTWLLCGTSSLRSIDSSELGERFLDCVIMDRIEFDVEDDILWRAAHHADYQVGIEANGEVTTRHAPELLEAYELTGGYVTWLRNNAASKLPKIEFSDAAKRQVIDYAKFVAYLRARPSKYQKEKAERELAARLVKVHIRLAKCLALVLNRPSVDAVVLARVQRVALDTSRGLVLDLVNKLRGANSAKGMDVRALGLYVNANDKDLRALVRFLREIHVIEYCVTTRQKTYRLTPQFRQLYDRVIVPALSPNQLTSR